MCPCRVLSMGDTQRGKPVLYLVGVGPSPQYMSLEGLRAARSAECLFGETYTTYMPRGLLVDVLGREPMWLSRRDLEDLEGRDVIECAKRRGSAALIVGGDPFMATTHAALVATAKREGISVRVIHGVSIVCAALSAACVSPYKLCGVATVTYPRMGVMSSRPYDVARRCLSEGLHTLLLLDVDEERGFMTLREAIDILRRLEEAQGGGIFTEERDLIVVSRLGYGDQAIYMGTLKELEGVDAKPPITLIVPGRLNDVEAECALYMAAHR